MIRRMAPGQLTQQNSSGTVIFGVRRERCSYPHMNVCMFVISRLKTPYFTLISMMLSNTTKAFRPQRSQGQWAMECGCRISIIHLVVVKTSKHVDIHRDVICKQVSQETRFHKSTVRKLEINEWLVSWLVPQIDQSLYNHQEGPY